MIELRTDGPHNPEAPSGARRVKEVPLHGKKGAGRVALVDDADYEMVMQYRWWVSESVKKNHGPYACARIGVGHDAPMKYMHQLITGYRQTDHENHNGLDNQRHNLRDASRGQNNANQRPIRGGSSPYKGVTFIQGAWQASIKVEGEHCYLGRHSTDLAAALAYDVASRQAFGEYACPNFPEGYAAMVEFHMNGPHTPEGTRDAANLVAEGVRYLNYATLGDCPGLEYPGDADSLIAALYTATQRLPQLLGQLRGFLAEQQATRPLADARTRSPAVQVSVAGGALLTAAAHADAMTVALHDAQNAIAGLYVKGGGDE